MSGNNTPAYCQGHYTQPGMILSSRGQDFRQSPGLFVPGTNERADAAVPLHELQAYLSSQLIRVVLKNGVSEDTGNGVFKTTFEFSSGYGDLHFAILGFCDLSTLEGVSPPRFQKFGTDSVRVEFFRPGVMADNAAEIYLGRLGTLQMVSPYLTGGGSGGYSGGSGGAIGDGSQASPFTALGQIPSGHQGVYWFQFGNIAPFEGYVYSDDGGGWLQILHYNHSAGENPALFLHSGSLPLYNPAVGFGEGSQGDVNNPSGDYWGHATPSLLSQIPDINELRIYGKTYAGKTVHVKTSLQSIIDYIATGSGSFSGLENNFEPILTEANGMGAHNEDIPAIADAFELDKGDYALTERPFGSSSASDYYGIRSQGTRWEVGLQANFNYPTDHRMMVRFNAPN